jgi:hypothetical protein
MQKTKNRKIVVAVTQLCLLNKEKKINSDIEQEKIL